MTSAYTGTRCGRLRVSILPARTSQRLSVRRAVATPGLRESQDRALILLQSQAAHSTGIFSRISLRAVREVPSRRSAATRAGTSTPSIDARPARNQIEQPGSDSAGLVAGQVDHAGELLRSAVLHGHVVPDVLVDTEDVYAGESGLVIGQGLQKRFDAAPHGPPRHPGWRAIPRTEACSRRS